MASYGIAALRGPRGLLTRLSEDSMNAGLYRMATELAHEMEVEIVKRTPVEGGNPDGYLRDSIKAEVVQSEGTGKFRITVKGLARGRYPDRGTGIYGKFKTPITGKTASGMRFFWAKRGRWVRTHAVDGQPAQHFMARGRDAAVRKYGRRIAKSLLGVK